MTSGIFIPIKDLVKPFVWELLFFQWSKKWVEAEYGRSVGLRSTRLPPVLLLKSHPSNLFLVGK